MRFLHFDAASGIYGRKLLPTVALAIAGASCIGTARAQAPIPVTISVSSVPRQTLKGIGASQPTDQTMHALRDQMADLTYRDLKMTVLRVWTHASPYLNNAKPRKRIVPDPTAASMALKISQQYGETGLIAAARSRGVTTLLLGPSYVLPDNPTATPASIPGPVELSMHAYTTRIAECIKILRDTYKIQINATGLANELTSIASSASVREQGGVNWSAANIVQGVTLLRSKLDQRGLQDVAIVAPENASTNGGAVEMVQALKASPTWQGLSGIATHSYEMAANDDMAAEVTAPNGASTKDWWITEVGGIGTPEPRGTGAVSLSARFLNDMNHGVTHWIWFIGFSTKYVPETIDTGMALTGLSPDQTSVVMHPKYWYFKQLRDAFPDGTVFRRAQSSLDGDMLWSYNQRAHVSAAAGKAPDGTWRIGAVNLTPITVSDKKPPHTVRLDYPAAPYAVTLKISDLGNSDPVQFAVTRSQPDGTSAATSVEAVTAINGQVTLVVRPQELVTLRSIPAVSRVP